MGKKVTGRKGERERFCAVNWYCSGRPAVVTPTLAAGLCSDFYSSLEDKALFARGIRLRKFLGLNYWLKGYECKKTIPASICKLSSRAYHYYIISL